MPARRRAAFGLWTALTFSSAVVVHGVVHAVGSRAFEWDSPAHVGMLVGAIGLLGTVVVRLGVFGAASDRRRRLALVRSALAPATTSFALVGLLTQILIAVALFVPEGVGLDPERLVSAIACGLIALLCSAFWLRATGERVVSFLVACCALRIAAAPRTALARTVIEPLRATAPYHLFMPTRPPPTFAH
jgi:hypothetical protein